jgi:hypothetical protein
LIKSSYDEEELSKSGLAIDKKGGLPPNTENYYA